MGSTAPPAVPTFDPDWLEARLSRLMPPGAARPPRYLVAWSGGADSTALLRALIELRDRRGAAALAVRALHVNHQLQPDAMDWVRHCRRTARCHGVGLTIATVDARAGAGESAEQAARDARLRAFAAALRPGECLLLGQHARDQLETLLLRVLRGSGPRGLAGMPERRALANGWLLRPLLDIAPEALRRYLVDRAEPWIEDPSNSDPRFDRNFVRAELLPKLEARWPGALRAASRSARLLRSAAETVDAQGRRDLAGVVDGDGIALPLLRRLSPTRRAGALRAWIDASNVPQPDEARLLQILAAASRREDAQVEIRWAGRVLRRHDERLVLTPDATAAKTEALPWRWTEGEIVLPDGCLRIAPAAHGDVDLDRLPSALAVRVRVPGRQHAADGGSIDVKSLLRETRVPAWRRATLPFVHDAAEARAEHGLLAIADLWLAPSIRASARTRHRGRFVWQAR